MIFKVLIKSELDELYEMTGLTVRIVKANKEKPKHVFYRSLV